MVLYSKAFRKCDAAENIGEESEEHEFPKNLEVSSKSTEASAILKMLKYVLYNRFFITSQCKLFSNIHPKVPEVKF